MDQGKHSQNRSQAITGSVLGSPQQMRKLGPYKPAAHFGFTPGSDQRTQYAVFLPMRRPWPAIFITALMLAIFITPLLAMPSFGQGQTDTVFGLGIYLFLTFWKIGWSVGVALLGMVLVGLLFAREKLIVRRREVVIRMEWLGLGFGATYRDEYLSNLRPMAPTENDGHTWRGRHLAFDYFDVPVHFGSHMDGERQVLLMQKIQQTLAGGIPERPENLPHIPESGEPGENPEQLVTSEISPVEPARAGPSSALVLVLANLIPVGGVVLLDWQIGELMLLFWIESAIIGVFNAMKMIVVGKAGAIVMVPFFIAHYGGFMAGHLVFLFSFFLDDGGDGSLARTAVIFTGLWPAIAGLFISHGYSFFHNFLGRQEYRGMTLQKLMQSPYRRIMIMHVTIIFGGFLVMAYGDQLVALVLLVALKIAVDFAAHRAQHSSGRKQDAGKPSVPAGGA